MRCNTDIASQAISMVSSERENFQLNFAATFASTKILVQTQWEAVRFDRVKHAAATRWRCSLERWKPGALAAGAISLCGTITLRAAAD